MKEKVSFQIRFAEPGDAEGIAEVYKEWLDFKGVLPYELIEPESVEDLFKHLNSPSSRKYLVAETNGKLIGACYIDTSFISLNTVRLGDMMVSKKYREQGIGSALVDNVIKFAKENNIKKVWLWTQEELKNAINMYTKKGFVLEGRQNRQFCGKDALVYGLVINN